MSDGFTKLFNSILTSSIWSADDKVRIMWITMLASADAGGYVTGAIPGMAAMARQTVQEAEKSIKALTEPDPYSRTKELKGRRLLEVDGGWQIINHPKYREKRDPEKRKAQNREAQERFRNKDSKQKVSQSKPIVSHDKPPSAQAEAEAEADKKQKGACAPGCSKTSDFLAKLLEDKIIEWNPLFLKKGVSGWSKDIDLLIRVDKVPPERIEAVINWLPSDSGDGGKWSGWRANILSGRKLRDKFSRLEISMNSKKKGVSDELRIR